MLDSVVLELLTQPGALASLLILTVLEIVLGIDNIIFIAIMVERVEEKDRRTAYRLGLGAALVTRLGLLFALSWILGLTKPLFQFLSHAISGRDLVMGFGGLFLIFKSASEIFEKAESRHEKRAGSGKKASLVSVIIQIMIIDIVFSLDSVITAVGLSDQVWVMATAMVIAVLAMMLFAKSVGDFILRHPSMQILALSFLLLIGVLLMAEAFDQHVGKTYVYFAMAFALLVEVFNMRQRKTSEEVMSLAEAVDAVEEYTEGGDRDD
jgi:predicted tellurium resistance membrane protein TerC